MPVPTTRYRAGAPMSRYALKRWRRSRLGRRLLGAEEQELRQVLPELFGRCCLQIGNWAPPSRLLAAAGGFATRSAIGSLPVDGIGGVVALDRLPLLDKSVDAVLLPHTLEFCADPRHLLRATSRALSDRAVTIVLGFNPWSPWGMRRGLGLGYRGFPDRSRFHGASRLCDWLELLGFEIDLLRRYGFGGRGWPGPGDDTPMRRVLPAYLILARKRVRPVTPVGRLRRAEVKSFVGGLALPEGRVARRESTRDRLSDPT